VARRYTSTVQGKGLKQHTCVGCGCEYRYELRRRRAATSQRGPVAAQRAAEEALAKALAEGVEPFGCPHCGVLQPEMIGTRRRPLHVLAAGAAGAVVLVVAGLTYTDTLTFAAATALAGAALALVAGLQAALALHDPNRDVAAGWRRARSQLLSGAVVLAKRCAHDAPPLDDADARGGPYRDAAPAPGERTLPLVVPGPSSAGAAAAAARALALGILALGVAAVPAAEVVRAAAGWPANDDFFPTVVGPGDAPVLYLPDEIHSLKGYWTGRAEAWLDVGDGDTAPRAIAATTNERDWSSFITYKSSESRVRERLWVALVLPPDPELAGLDATVHVALDAVWPEESLDSFDERTRSFAHDAPLRLAPPGAGALYADLFRAGFGGGGVLLVLASLWLARQARAFARSGHAHRVVGPAPAPPSGTPARSAPLA
jgi:hypothetical protein